MGKTKGVDVRQTSIRLTFTWEGKQHKKTIIVDGEPIDPTPANIRYAERLALEIREKIRLGVFVLQEYFPDAGDTDTATTVANQIQTYLAAKRVTPSTLAAYKSAATFWDKNLPQTPIKSLKPSQVLKVLADHTQLSGKTLANYLSVLRDALDLACRDGLLKTNPVEGIANPSWQKPLPDPFDNSDRDRIIQQAQSLYPGHVHNMVEFWFWSGLRTGELLGLRWSSVDLQRKTLLVHESLVRGEHRASTKTSVARTVILNSKAMEALQRQNKLSSEGIVFLDPRTNKPWAKEQPFRQNYWNHLLKDLGIRYRRAYCCRHTYATAMLMAGMTPAFCAKQLGHSVEMFLRTYSKWVDGQRDDLEMHRLEQSLKAIPGITQG